MPEVNQFKRGDVVIHPLRPEWGDGVVEQATNITHEGHPAQRLIITFANHGRATINTAVAGLIAREGYIAMTTASTPSSAQVPSPTPTPTNAGRGWLDALDTSRSAQPHELWRLSEAMTDPFVPPQKRLQATLASFRFGNDPRHARNLLDWAVAQTNLNDPLSKYTRHEMEQAFRRFVRDRDNHLFDLVRALKRQSRQDLLAEVQRTTTDPLARQTLDRAIRA